MYSTRWRLLIPRAVSDADQQVQFSGLVLRSVSGGADLCTGGTASASSQGTGGSFLASFAFDGLAATDWRSQAQDTVHGTINPFWLEMLLTVGAVVVEYAITATLDSGVLVNYTPRTWNLQYYDAVAGAWKSADSRTVTGWLAGETKTFAFAVPAIATTIVTMGGTTATSDGSATELSIINQALLMLQVSPALSLGDDSPQAQAAVSLYAGCRDEVLRSHPWNFALTRSNLTRLSTTSVYGLSYSYQLPTDCLKIDEVSSPRLENLRLYAPDCNAEELTPPLRYYVESNRIVSNEDIIYLRYVARITEVSLYDSLFVSALAANLAMKLAYALAGTSSQQELMTRTYGEYLRQARSVDGSEQQALTSWTGEIELLAARYNYNRG